MDFSIGGIAVEYAIDIYVGDARTVRVNATLVKEVFLILNIGLDPVDVFVNPDGGEWSYRPSSELQRT